MCVVCGGLHVPSVNRHLRCNLRLKAYICARQVLRTHALITYSKIVINNEERLTIVKLVPGQNTHKKPFVLSTFRPSTHPPIHPSTHPPIHPSTPHKTAEPFSNV